MSKKIYLLIENDVDREQDTTAIKKAFKNYDECYKYFMDEIKWWKDTHNAFDPTFTKGDEYCEMYINGEYEEKYGWMTILYIKEMELV